MQVYTADLHIHTLLSPCAEVEMTPHNIMLHALKNGIDIVAITDHNAIDNLPAAIQVAAEYGITLIPGMELETKEEVHVIALFGKMRDAVAFNRIVESCYSGSLNNSEKLGPQFVVDADDQLVREKLEMLHGPVKMSLSAAVNNIHDCRGLAIAAHIDRPAYSVLAVLGFIPPDVSFDAVEVSRNVMLASIPAKFKHVKLPIITSSDAHFMSAFNEYPKTKFLLAEPSFAEISKAFKSCDGRKILVE